MKTGTINSKDLARAKTWSPRELLKEAPEGEHVHVEIDKNGNL